MAKTYAEKNNRKSTNWLKFLNKKCEKMTENQVTAKSNLSGDWVTCACGNQCAIIPRDSYGVPIDKKLRNLGGAFHDSGIAKMEDYIKDALNTDYKDDIKKYYKLANKSREKALKILFKIEERSAELIKQVKKNGK